MAGKGGGFAVFRALGDPTRYRLVRALLAGERCACELPSIVKKAQPTVSLQLKFLVGAGILQSRKDGRKVLYRIRNTKVRKMILEVVK